MKIINLFPKKLDGFNSIDNLPIDYWHKVIETNDYSWLLKSKRIISNKEQEKLKEVWNLIFDEFIDEFGAPEYMVNVLILRRDIACLQVDLYLTNDRSLNTTINIKKAELESLLKKDSKANFSKTMAIINKNMPYRIDGKLTSVKEFYSIAKLIEEQNRVQKQA